MNKPLALFLGAPESLPYAYPSELREQLAQHVSLYDQELTAGNWKQHKGVAQEAEIIFSTWNMAEMNEGFLSHFPKLRAVFYAAGTVKNFVTDHSYARDVVVCSAAAANAVPVAEYTLATVLLSLKRFWHFSRMIDQHRSWERNMGDAPGAYGSTVGLVSLGAVGRAVAEMLLRFELKVIAYDPFLSPEVAKKIGIQLVSLEELFSRSDVISLHTPWLPETVNMIGAALLRRMKNGATLVNTSRGAIINEAELCQVFAERLDLNAVLDVTYPEPPKPDSPLYTLDNIVLTPHIAGSMGNEVARMGQWMVDEMERWLDGKPLRYQVTQEMLARIA